MDASLGRLEIYEFCLWCRAVFEVFLTVTAMLVQFPIDLLYCDGVEYYVSKETSHTCPTTSNDFISELATCFATKRVLFRVLQPTYKRYSSVQQFLIIFVEVSYTHEN